MPKISGFGLVVIAALSIALAQCSASGGTATTRPTAAPTATPSPTPSPAPIIFTGSTITNNVMALPCDTNETFTISQSGFSGNFSLTVNNSSVVITPPNGTSSQTFSILDNAGNSPGNQYLATATANGTTGAPTGVLTINVTTGDCG